MGLIIGISIILLWAGHLFFALDFVNVDYLSPVFYLHILLQAYLYTGLFITGHDAMHGAVHSNRKINNVVGYLSVFFYAGMSYRKLVKNHYLHHRFPAEGKDPDFYTRSQNFWIWWAVFFGRYLTVIQLVVMAVFFNLLIIWFDKAAVISFWVIPAFLSTFQLFYVGTYLPHKRPHLDSMKPHNARTQRRNHLWAMLSCYFFGYHHEHHETPFVPWWQLYKAKNRNLASTNNAK